MNVARTLAALTGGSCLYPHFRAAAALVAKRRAMMEAKREADMAMSHDLVAKRLARSLAATLRDAFKL